MVPPSRGALEAGAPRVRIVDAVSSPWMAALSSAPCAAGSSMATGPGFPGWAALPDAPIHRRSPAPHRPGLFSSLRRTPHDTERQGPAHGRRHEPRSDRRARSTPSSPASPTRAARRSSAAATPARSSASSATSTGSTASTCARCPGVAEVVRISTPFKLVSRQHHPEMSTVYVGETRVPIGPDTFTLIAGPCAVETPEQTLAAAQMAQGRRGHAAARRRVQAAHARRTPSRGSASAGCRSSPTCGPRPACRW